MNENRIKKITGLLKAHELSALFIAPSNDLEAVLGFSPYLCERFQGLFIKDNGTCFYISSSLTADEVRSNVPELLVYGYNSANVWADVEEFFVKEGLISKTIGVNNAMSAVHALDIMEKMDIKFKNGSYIIDKANAIKDEEELSYLKKAAEMADIAIGKTALEIKAGITEGKIKEILGAYSLEQGAENYNAIVATGPNSSFPHYMPKGEGRTVLENDIVLIDFCLTYKGYFADMTRTFFVGEPSEEMKKVYNIVLNANLKGEEAVKEGVSASSIDDASRSHIAKHGYGEFFTTSTGHGIGTKPHEQPFINSQNQEKLVSGNAFSVEPGIYLADNFGVRIEDIVVIHENGEKEVINNYRKDMQIL